MLSKGTNIVLLSAIWTNITVSISSVPAISIFLLSLRRQQHLEHMILFRGICSVRSHGKMLPRQIECPIHVNASMVYNWTMDNFCPAWDKQLPRGRNLSRVHQNRAL